MNTTTRKGKKNVDAGIDAAMNSLAMLKPNADWAKLPLFDRTDWKRVRFGDVVQNCNETCDLAEAGLERFVAMEHLEPGSLHVRSWGNVADGTTFTRRCWPGQVLFGKRRAYQRKVAVAEFEAVVSGDIYVLAPNDNKRLLPELLPFLCLSERFFQHAVGTSAGSLSPRTNWTSLASFEFDLPPLEQQRRIAEILCAVDEEEQVKLAIANASDTLQAAITESLLDKLSEGRVSTLESVLTGSPESGCSAPPSPTETGHYVLSLASLTKSGYSEGYLKPIPPTKAMLDCRLKLGDFLISRSNTQELVGLVGIFNEDRDDVSFPDTMMRLPVDERIINKKFLQIVLQSHRGRLHMMRTAAGTSSSMKKINRQSLRTFKVPVPSENDQDAAIAKIEKVRGLCTSARLAYSHAMRLKMDLIQSVTSITP
jgi:type I restriction enzyme S subunit